MVQRILSCWACTSARNAYAQTFARECMKIECPSALIRNTRLHLLSPRLHLPPHNHHHCPSQQLLYICLDHNRLSLLLEMSESITWNLARNSGFASRMLCAAMLPASGVSDDSPSLYPVLLLHVQLPLPPPSPWQQKLLLLPSHIRPCPLQFSLPCLNASS